MSEVRYPDYKSSGGDWFSEVPSHWDVKRLKWSVASCRNGIWGGEATGGEEDIACARVADFDRTRLTVKFTEPTMRSVTAKERAGRQLRRGNLLLEKSGGGEGQPVGVVVLYDDDRPAVCSNFVARMELAEGMVPSFWRYVHAAAYCVRLTRRSINQTSGIQNLDQDRYLDELAPFPPEIEQVAIAAFLDRETGKIDALVEEQRRLIELLKEKRHAAISHAVTKGIDRSAKMKPSWVPWLGDVPEHWVMMPLRRLTQDNRPITYGIVQPGQPDVEGRYMVRGQDYSRGWAPLEQLFRVSAEVEEPYRRARLATGDVVMTIVGAGTGNTAVVPSVLEGANITQTTARVAPETDLVRPEFLAFSLASWVGQTQVQLFQKGAAQPGLNLEHLKAFQVPLPPLREQDQIARYLTRLVDRLDALVVEAVEAMLLFRERRAALISAAVTGKINVQQATADQENAA